MSFILSYIFLVWNFLPVSSLLLFDHVFCNQSIVLPSIDVSIRTSQSISINLCNKTFDTVLYSNENFFSQNHSIDQRIQTQPNFPFTYRGHIVNDDNDDDQYQSAISIIIYPQLQIFLYLNGTYYYYLSSKIQSSIVLKFSQRHLLQYYPQLVNETSWKILQQEQENYQQNSFMINDLHFLYELLTLRCESDSSQLKAASFCTLALFIDELLYEKSFHANVYYIYTFIEHFNFLLRTLTNHEYDGFRLKTVQLLEHVEIYKNRTFEQLRKLSHSSSLSPKHYCLVHQMFGSNRGSDPNFVLGYPSSTQTYDVGGICSLPFTISRNHTDEINLNTGLSILNENITSNLSIFFNGLMKTSYLFFRQMGLNLTLCTKNATRKGFFHFNTEILPIVQHCVDLIPISLHAALKRRAHLCFNYVNNYNSTNQSIKPDTLCRDSIDFQLSVAMKRKVRKFLGAENPLNETRRGEWFEGNIVGMILTFSLLIWIPVSCYVHFCVDEIRKKSFLEKQDMETLPMKPNAVEQVGIGKQTQTE